MVEVVGRVVQADGDAVVVEQVVLDCERVDRDFVGEGD